VVNGLRISNGPSKGLDMAKWFIEFCVLSAISFALVFPVHAAAPFYEGKTIRLIVGFSAGGGFDTYSRLIGRHLGNHIPSSRT